MKYIGNFINCVPEKILDNLKHGSFNKFYLDEEDKKENDAKIWLTAGYDLDKISHYEIYNDKFKNIIKLPKSFGKILEIWFTKLDPGDMFPVHQDSYDYRENPINIHRYCMMLQDYEIGHVFVCGGNHLENYKLGDTYELGHNLAWHAACNIGLTPRLTMQIVSEKN
jgi:hypothetical protein